MNVSVKIDGEEINDTITEEVEGARRTTTWKYVNKLKGDEGLMLYTSTFLIPLRRPIYITNVVDKTKF